MTLKAILLIFPTTGASATGPAGGLPHCRPYLLRLWSERRPVVLESLAAQGISAIDRGLKRGVHARFSVGMPCGAVGFEGDGTFLVPPHIFFFGSTNVHFGIETQHNKKTNGKHLYTPSTPPNPLSPAGNPTLKRPCTGYFCTSTHP